MTQLRHAQLRGIGVGFSDTYEDVFRERDRIQIMPADKGLFFLPDPELWHILSDIFEYTGELTEFPSIWAAIPTEWGQRHTYPTDAERMLAFNDALTVGGYTGPGGQPLP